MLARIYNVILEILLDDCMSWEGLNHMPLAIAIKNALVRMEAASLRKPGLTISRSGLYTGTGNHRILKKKKKN